MTEDLSRFAPHLKKYITDWSDRQTKERRYDAVSKMADPNSIPCIVIALWLGEYYNWPEELKSTYDVNYKFYGYTEIKNKPPGCPW